MHTVPAVKGVKPPKIWETLVEDYLELACHLTPAERLLLLSELRKYRIQSEAILDVVSFLIGERMISISQIKASFREHWIYWPKEKEIKKYEIVEIRSSGKNQR